MTKRKKWNEKYKKKPKRKCLGCAKELNSFYASRCRKCYTKNFRNTNTRKEVISYNGLPSDIGLTPDLAARIDVLNLVDRQLAQKKIEAAKIFIREGNMKIKKLTAYEEQHE